MASPTQTLLLSSSPAMTKVFIAPSPSHLRDLVVFLLTCLSTTLSYIHALLPSHPSPASLTSSPKISSPVLPLDVPRPRTRRASSSTTAICYSPRSSMYGGGLPLPLVPPSPALDSSEFALAQTEDETEAELGVAPTVEAVVPSKRNSGIWVERVVVQQVVVVQSR
ncbi:hypothetical protein JCM8097_007251 [Rhodosporidiobolus ruineniae]